MQRNRALLAVCFTAGVIGALANSLLAWGCGQLGLTQLAGVQLAPSLSPAWLYPRLVWGGIWGLAYWLTVGHYRARRHWIRKGLWVSLLASIAQLFYLFPYRTPYGPMGIALGNLTPLFVVGYNLAWGFVTGLFTRLFWGRS